MLGKISILLFLFVTGVLMIAGIGSIVMGVVKNQHRKVFIVRGSVLSGICLIILVLIYFFTDTFAQLAL